MGAIGGASDAAHSGLPGSTAVGTSNGPPTDSVSGGPGCARSGPAGDAASCAARRPADGQVSDSPDSASRSPGGSPPLSSAAGEAKDLPMRGPVLRVLPGVADSAAVARAMARQVLGDASPAVDTVMLLISELVTNAIVHTRSGAPGGTVTVALCPGPAGLLVQVRDDGGSSVPRLVPRPWRGPADASHALTAAGSAGNAQNAPSRPASSPAADLTGALDNPCEPEHGYGLVLVDALADSWGTLASPDGRITWFRVGRHPRRAD